MSEGTERSYRRYVDIDLYWWIYMTEQRERTTSKEKSFCFSKYGYLYRAPHKHKSATTFLQRISKFRA